MWEKDCIAASPHVQALFKMGSFLDYLVNKIYNASQIQIVSIGFVLLRFLGIRGARWDGDISACLTSFDL
jgi:hypothetical protein